MASKRVTCHHCDFLFYPEEGVSLDNCPVCGRTVEVKPAPAPLPGSEELAEALAEISAAGFGGVAEGMRLHISDLTRRLADAEAAYKHVKQCLHISQGRAFTRQHVRRGRAGQFTPVSV